MPRAHAPVSRGPHRIWAHGVDHRRNPSIPTAVVPSSRCPPHGPQPRRDLHETITHDRYGSPPDPADMDPPSVWDRAMVHRSVRHCTSLAHMSGSPVGDAAALGCYVLPGGVPDPRVGLDQARVAESIGLGAVWIGERYDTKDLPSLAGAIGQVTSRIRIGAAITHTGLRHPMVLASMGQTLQALTAGRFVLGIGRSAAWRWRAYGVEPPTLRTMIDTADILRRLWAGQTVSYDGPAGRFPSLRLAQRPDVPPPPLLLAAVGPKTIAAAGQHFDGVILHPFLTVDAVRRSVEIARQAAVDAGRDPSSIRCVATVVVAPGRDADQAALAIEARAAGYFSVEGLGDALVRANRWSAADLATYRSQEPLVALGGLPADKHLTRQQLVALCQKMPPSWLPSASAAGDVDSCVQRLRHYLEAGADEILLHGTSGAGLEALATTFARGPGG
jgi:5,10-methylenetetrahydromethanopterin reductase